MHGTAPVCVPAVVNAGMAICGQVSVGRSLVGTETDTGFQASPHERLQRGLSVVRCHRKGERFPSPAIGVLPTVPRSVRSFRSRCLFCSRPPTQVSSTSAGP